MNNLGWREEDWIKLSLDERARKVCAHKLGDWLGALESERQLRRMRAKK